MDEIADTWDDTDPDDVMSYTDTDLTFSRNWSTRVYDPTGEYEDKVRAIKEQWELDDMSATFDFATRVGIAKLIDDTEAYITRDEYDVSYTIPPRGWVKTNVRGNTDYEHREDHKEYIQVSSPGVCLEMVEDIVEDGVFETKKEAMYYGVDVLVGEE